MIDRLLYALLYASSYLVALFPLKVSYLFSDVFYYLVYYIVRYRRKIVRKNLFFSFPEKNRNEILFIEKKFYKHFCDYYFETVKLLRMPDSEMRKRFVFKNIGEVKDLLEGGKSCIMLLGHYGNWEWVTSIAGLLEDDKYFIGQIYRPLKNKVFDRFFLQLRDRFKTVCIPKKDTLREIVKLESAKKNFLLGFISDQKPSLNNEHFWTTFLNQETSFLTGAERIAKHWNIPVLYLDVKVLKRGYYESSIVPVALKPRETKESEITEKYAELMERNIRRNPPYWLWSHNRWKHKRSENLHKKTDKYEKGSGGPDS